MTRKQALNKTRQLIGEKAIVWERDEWKMVGRGIFIGRNSGRMIGREILGEGNNWFEAIEELKGRKL